MLGTHASGVLPKRHSLSARKVQKTGAQPSRLPTISKRARLRSTLFSLAFSQQFSVRTPPACFPSGTPCPHAKFKRLERNRLGCQRLASEHACAPVCPLHSLNFRCARLRRAPKRGTPEECVPTLCILLTVFLSFIILDNARPTFVIMSRIRPSYSGPLRHHPGQVLDGCGLNSLPG